MLESELTAVTHKGFDHKGFDHKGFDHKGFDHKGFFTWHVILI